MSLTQIFTRDAILVNVKSTAKDELFTEMAEALGSLYPELNCADAVFALKTREEQMSTGIMHSVGVPHASLSCLNKTIGAIGISKQGIDYDSLDKSPVHIVFMLLTGEGHDEEHIKVLRSLALVLQTPDFVQKAVSCKTASEVFDLIVKCEK
jgi:mannitol/fructose-specific phosphotransferase system IIA component (Ntr-type)